MKMLKMDSIEVLSNFQQFLNLYFYNLFFMIVFEYTSLHFILITFKYMYVSSLIFFLTYLEFNKFLCSYTIHTFKFFFYHIYSLNNQTILYDKRLICKQTKPNKNKKNCTEPNNNYFVCHFCDISDIYCCRRMLKWMQIEQ